MHTRLIVLTNVFKAKYERTTIQKNKKRIPRYKTSLQVRKAVFNSLEEEGFIQQGKFVSGPADWFAIGGRWSGDLTAIRLNSLLWNSC